MIDWLSREGNYNRWRGGDKYSGKMKCVIATEILQLMKDAGIMTERVAKYVITKIGSIEKQFHEASDWLNNTGQGITCESMLMAYNLKR